MEFLLILVVFVLVIAIVAAPLRRGQAEQVERREASELAELESAKEAKYREIRDAEMDFRTGKLSQEDHRALDRQLRAEAIQLLRRIDRLKPAERSEQPAKQAGDEAKPEAPPRDDLPSATMR